MLIMQKPSSTAQPPHNPARLRRSIGFGVNAALILISVSSFHDRNALLRSQHHLLTVNEKINAKVVAEAQPGMRNDETKSERIAMSQFWRVDFCIFLFGPWLMHACFLFCFFVALIFLVYEC